jgi:PPOX class probable F420-dependent enzyme
MPKPPLPAELEEFLSHPNPAVIATVGRDGRPATVATWYVWDRGRVLVNMDERRKRLANLRRDPGVSITVLGDGDWYRHVSLRGRVGSLEPDPRFDDIDRVSRHYTAQPFRQRDRGRVSAWIEIDSWHAWAGAGPWVEPGG